ncbi:MAG: hypothetical protein QXK06_01975 [Candidatus Diapherotrites archaeon]
MARKIVKAILGKRKTMKTVKEFRLAGNRDTLESAATSRKKTKARKLKIPAFYPGGPELTVLDKKAFQLSKKAMALMDKALERKPSNQSKPPFVQLGKWKGYAFNLPSPGSKPGEWTTKRGYRLVLDLMARFSGKSKKEKQSSFFSITEISRVFDSEGRLETEIVDGENRHGVPLKITHFDKKGNSSS